ncbi:MAG: hypothetical protein HYU51_06190 [Candidatus Rokubacteria bacterium]|nr:hypothetical protein [Candidatus Rokubacteria bacterium]
MDRAVVERDPHLARGCSACHKGDGRASDKQAAHAGLVKRPSDDVRVCGECHDTIAGTYRTSLHYTTAGLKHGALPRFGPAEAKQFAERVFPASCASCHASCGECHVKAPTVAGVGTGLVSGHRFVRRNEGRTCAACHGGRVYPEFTGEYGGMPDVHYEKGMMCIDCHSAAEMHGDGTSYTSRREVKSRPSCAKCHPPGSEKTPKASAAHQRHASTVSCVACHAATPYRNCSECHLGRGATARPDFVLGASPRDPTRVTTLRRVPTVKGTFDPAGLGLAAFDAAPNYWDTVPHNIRKRTDRTRSCDVCHVERRGFLTRETLPQDGSRANEALVRVPRQIKE